MSPERKRFWLAAFYTMGQVWPFLEGTADRIRVFDSALADLTVAQLERGVSWLVGFETNQRQPSPGDIRAGSKSWNLAANTGCKPPEPKLLSPLSHEEERALLEARDGRREGVSVARVRLERDP